MCKRAQTTQSQTSTHQGKVAGLLQRARHDAIRAFLQRANAIVLLVKLPDV